jgi:spermidine synthase
MAEGRVAAGGEGAAATVSSLPRALPFPAAAALVFIAAGAVLMLEILAVRLLAPYVGLTLETTTAVIGAALAGIAVGAAVGGYLADRTDTRKLIVGLLVGGGLLTLLTVPVVHWLGPGARGEGDLAVLGITLIALVPAAAVLSAVSPAVAHLQLHDLKVSGTVVGSLSAWATAGALLGTFGSGFVLIPLMPVSSAVLIIGTVLVLTGIGLGASSRAFPAAGLAAIAIGALALGALSATSQSPCITETQYHCIRLVADPARPSGYHLMLDDGYHSYVDLKDPTHLEYSYVEWIADGVDSSFPAKKPLDAVFVGGGGFTLPRWLLATRPGSDAQVLELDQGLVDFDEERLGLRPSDRLRVAVGDARIGMLDLEGESADLVVGDAFSSNAVPWHLATTEWVEEVQRVLRPDGLYALNVIDYQPLDLVKAEAATLLDAFEDVQLVTFPTRKGDLRGGNVVLLASDRKLPTLVSRHGAKGAITGGRPEIEALVGDAEPLRDDYAPADQLLSDE